MLALWAVRTSLCSALLALTGTAAWPAQAANWVEVTRLADGTVVSIDRESVKTSPPRAYARDFPAVQVTARYGSAGGATRAETQNSVNCAARTITALRIAHFARDGSVLRRWSRVDYDFNYRPVTPDSVGDAILHAVCATPQVSGALGG
jgi:hypothetical protein